MKREARRGSQTNSSQTNGGGSGSNDGSTATGGTNSPAQDSGGTTGGTTSSTTRQRPQAAPTGGTTGTTGPAGSSSNGSNPVLGGGPVLGVVSKQKTEGIHSFGDKTKYNEWLFIYDPSQDKGQMLVGPYNPNMFLGANSTGLGNSTQNPPGTGTGTTPGMRPGPGTANPTRSPTPPAAPTQ